MKKFAQIYLGKAHWIFESEEIQEFAPDIIIIDITDIKYKEVKEGWNYSFETCEFTAPEPFTPEPPLPPQPTIEEMTEEILLETKYQTTLLELSQ